MIENRVLKMTEKRQVKALAKYEGSHARLSQVIKSYSESIRSLRNRLRWMKKSFRQLENSYRTETSELLTIRKRHKHLLDLAENKQLGEWEQLSNQLKEAENTIELQEKNNQVEEHNARTVPINDVAVTGRV